MLARGWSGAAGTSLAGSGKETSQCDDPTSGAQTKDVLPRKRRELFPKLAEVETVLVKSRKIKLLKW